jgi:hypothetical protein
MAKLEELLIVQKRSMIMFIGDKFHSRYVVIPDERTLTNTCVLRPLVAKNSYQLPCKYACWYQSDYGAQTHGGGYVIRMSSNLKEKKCPKSAGFIYKTVGLHELHFQNKFYTFYLQH